MPFWMASEVLRSSSLFVFVLWCCRCALGRPFRELRTFRSTVFFVPFSFSIFWMRFWMALEVLRSSSCFVSFLICSFPDALWDCPGGVGVWLFSSFVLILIFVKRASRWPFEFWDRTFVLCSVFVLGVLDTVLDGLEFCGVRLLFRFTFRFSHSKADSFRFVLCLFLAGVESFRFRFVLKPWKPKCKTKKYATVSF